MAPVWGAYVAQLQKRGTFENNAQTPAAVAEVIVASLKSDSTGFRTLTSPAAAGFTEEKIQADPDGSHLQSRLRRELRGIG